MPRVQRSMMLANSVNVLSQIIDRVISNELDIDSAVKEFPQYIVRLFHKVSTTDCI